MKYTSLLNDIEKAFSSFQKPLIIYAASANTDITKGDYSAIQQNYCSISRDEMTYEQCSMMITDGALISDESLCYFLPRLAMAVFQESGNEYLLYQRLEYLDKNLLSQEQKTILECLITSLKELEQEIEMEEERELEQAQIDWEQEIIGSKKIDDKLLLAIARGDIDNVKNLINQGANVNRKDNHGNSPFDITKYRGHTNVVELLKQAGAR
jgi:hypothetical protein